MKTYTTKQGDMWDMIANEQMGSTSYTGKLMDVNMSLSAYFIFPAGITLTVPDVDTATATLMPPWKRVAG